MELSSEEVTGLWFSVQRAGTALKCLDYGGSGAPAILLHGLAGTAYEWANTASRLTSVHRVIAPDQRGHGRSERHPADTSRDAFVEDVVAVIDELELEPVCLIGQSLGAHTAFLVAARHPDLVRALIVAEASPVATTPETVTSVRDWLASWPVPFSSPAEGQAFFGGGRLRAWAWARGLEERDGGWWPSFEPDVMLRTLSATVGESYWEEWVRITAPTLIVRAAGGAVPEAEVDEMVASLPKAQLVEIAGAGHDVHLEAPLEWCRTIERFLASVGE